MKQLLFALLFIPALLFAQEDQHYLAAVSYTHLTLPTILLV